jgi:hypothetical protein
MGDRTAVNPLTVVLPVRRFHTAITWGVLGLFTATMVCGQGLHCLCGFSHSSCCAHDFCEHSDDDGPHSCGVSAWQASSCDHSQIDATGCPICSFFALAHGLSFLPPTLCESLIVAESVAAIRCLASGDDISVYRSRAPPVSAC